MTREEFIENVGCWSELIDFCYDEGCNYCDDVYTEDSKDEYFNDIMVDMARDANDWRDLLQQLDGIPSGDDYYIRDEYGEWRCADNEDFYEYKDDVLQWADDRNVWDEDEDDDVDEEIFEDNDIDDDLEDDEEFEEGCSLSELFTSCTSRLQTIEIAAGQKQKQEEQEFKQFISAAV